MTNHGSEQLAPLLGLFVIAARWVLRFFLPLNYQMPYIKVGVFVVNWGIWNSWEISDINEESYLLDY